jgi:hypothetical protein
MLPFWTQQAGRSGRLGRRLPITAAFHLGAGTCDRPRMAARRSRRATISPKYAAAEGVRGFEGRADDATFCNVLQCFRRKRGRGGERILGRGAPE